MTVSTTGHHKLAGFSIGERQGDATQGIRLELAGQLDAEGALQLAEELDEIFRLGARRVELRMEHVSFISSSGVGSLVASISEYREEGGDILLKDLSEGLRSVFDMLGLLDYVSVG